MGIWLELGIFIVVLAWGFWQLYDVKQAKAQRIAAEKQQAQTAKASEGTEAPQETKAPPLPLPPA